MSTINWTDPKAKISKYFTVGEALWLPRLKIYHTPTDVEKANILELAYRMDKVREALGKSLTVNVWIRPVVTLGGKSIDYNALVGGAAKSSHKDGRAVDLNAKGMTAEEVRTALKDKLAEIDLFMEDDVTWCHFQTTPTKSGNRIFKP